MKPLDSGGNSDHVTFGLGLERVTIMVRWGQVLPAVTGYV